MLCLSWYVVLCDVLFCNGMLCFCCYLCLVVVGVVLFSEVVIVLVWFVCCLMCVLLVCCYCVVCFVCGLFVFVLLCGGLFNVCLL